jgi:hypothetical protein
MKRKKDLLQAVMGAGLVLAMACGAAAQTNGAPGSRAQGSGGPGKGVVAGNTVTPEAAAKFKETVRLLSSDDFKERQRGEAAVQNLPPEAFSLVQQAVDDPKMDPEVRERLKRALPTFQTKAVTASAAEQEAADLAWRLKVTLDAYEQGKHKNPKWDGLVRDAFTTEANPAAPSTPEAAAQLAGMFRKAVEAGADDPVVLHFYAAVLSRTQGADRKELRRLLTTAAEGFNRETYPPLLKLAGFMAAIEGIGMYPGNPQDDEAQRQRYFDLAAGEWPAVTKMKDIPDAQLFKWSDLLIKHAEGMQPWELMGLVLHPLEQSKGTSACTYYLIGKQAMQEAWSARGYGMFGEIPAERIEQMKEACAQARTNYERAWKANPHSPWAPAAMIEVELLSPTGGNARSGREAMEEWFKRAMDANPDNAAAVEMKLNYLRGRWYGSDAELLAFAREMVAKGHVQMALVTAHRWLAEESGNPDAYFAQSAVWRDMKRVYEPILAKAPADVFDRSWYLKYAALAGDWSVAAAQLKLLGDHPAVEVFGSMEMYDALRKKVAARAGG